MSDMERGRSIGAKEAGDLASGFFYTIATAIMVAVVSIMSLVCGVMLWADSAEDLETKATAPGGITFNVKSAGIFTISAGGSGADCVLSKNGAPTPLTRPKDVWFGALSGKDITYATHLGTEGRFHLACKDGDGPVDPVVAKGRAENALWLAAWMVGLPVALMGAALLAAWMFVRRSIPAGGLEIRRTDGT